MQASLWLLLGNSGLGLEGENFLKGRIRANPHFLNKFSSAGPASKLILCCVSSEIISRPLIGQKYECYIVIEVIDVDELDEGNITAAAENKTNNEG